MFYTIYKTTNKINGKIYIGKHQTKDLEDSYMGSGKYLKRAIEKYGIENFEKEILFIFDTEAEMNAKEAELVTEEFVLEDTNYNLCPGGQGGFGYLNSSYWNTEKRNRLGLLGGFNNPDKMTEASRKKYNEGAAKGGQATKKKVVGIHLQNKKVSEGIIDNLFKGKTHTEDWKIAHSKRMKGRLTGKDNPQFGKSWIWHELFGNKKVDRNKIPDYINQGWIKTYKPGYKVLQK